jgi:predicted ATPase/transcriptional regulator with GAF, ATPase, and Fis domain
VAGSDVPVEIRGYDVGEAMVRTGPFAFYRGRRARDGRPVLLKVPARPSPRRAEIDALERERDLLQAVSLDGVPRVVDFLRDPPCLVIEDEGLRPAAGSGGPPAGGVAWFLNAAGELAAVLGRVHHANVVCGGVSPAAVLASADGRRVQLVDFTAATRSAPDTTSSALGWGPTPYTSPEQTGRINRSTDHRSDLYSLGATLYQWLTGTPPFRSDDSLELIHAHLAKTPVPPHLIADGTPEQVSAIVMRLLEKTAEDRYQSASGVKGDLDACAQMWEASGVIAPFDLARHDVSERFLIPQRLYGRDRELAALVAAFDAACEGRAALVLVSGYSGIGKTSLISELYRPIVKQRGYFLSGKFDQVMRNLPYGALIQAFRGFVWQVLAESEHRLAGWRSRLTAALGANGGVLAEVIPEIELVLGKQPVPPALDPAEAQNRFRYVFQSFVAALAQKEHPFVVFLDDLQWVDAATLDLLHALLTGPDLNHVLFIGAYRDNEVDASHRLTWAIERLQTAGALVPRVSLGPLSRGDVVLFLCETLRGSPEDVDALAALILEKTDGNPFFVIQFLKTLQQEGLFTFDGARGAWSFTMAAVAAAGMTDNVIDLMTRKIRRLSTAAQRVLTMAACIGSPFAWPRLLTVTGQTGETAAAGLAEALDAGLVQPAVGRADAYAFLHDRVQQAAYDLIPDADKQRTHLEVGRLLVAECGPSVPDDRLFDVVSHLNVGRALLTDDRERVATARLNLAAGRKAKTSAAYSAAAAYFDEGISLVPDVGESWAAEYGLMFALRLEAAEAHYLAGHFDPAEQCFAQLLARAASALDQAQVHSLRIVLYENQSRYADAVASAREGLALFGVTLPVDDADADAAVDREIDEIQRLRAGRPIASLSEMPAATDVAVQTIMRMLTLMWSPAYIGGRASTARLISAMLVRFSLERGLTEDSAYGCVTHAITIGPVRHDYAAAFEWGQLALALNVRFDDAKRRAKIHQQIHAHVQLWRRPFASCIEHAREACRSGLESGDFVYAGYGAVTETWPAWLVSRSLDRFLRDYTPTLAVIDRIQMTDFRSALEIMLHWALALQGRTAGGLSLSDDTFDEDAFVARHEGSAAPFFLTFVYTAKLHLAVLLARYEDGMAMAARGRAVTVVGTMWPVLLDFWGALAIAGAWPSLAEPRRTEAWAELSSTRASLKDLADNAPENFRCFWLIVSAEMKRLGGQLDEAARLCDAALSFARETENLQQEALANEQRATLCLARGDDAAAVPYLRAARQCYAAWGATIKVRQLEDRYGAPAFAARTEDERRAVAPVQSEPADLDMATVLKMARAIAVEIELDALLKSLMRIALENAGAGRGVFLQEREGSWFLEAEATADADAVRVRQATPLDAAADLSHTVVRYVARTGRDLVVGNLAADERFGGDPYVARARAKSVLCVPVGHHGRSSGLLYLENNLTTEAFTPARIEMMRILAAQAAISIENARLYEAMRTEIERRTVAEQSLREALAEVGALKDRLETENVYLQEEIRTQHNFNDIVGNSPPLLEVLRSVELVAPTESTVLLTGETGVGKELFARAVHSRSPRRDRPLVKVNCGAIAPGLVESELFGHVKGAFTGAIDKRTGRFEVANGGTILLDEIGELPLDAQVKLLRVLQEHEFEPVGSSRTVRVDVRVIAATNRNLAQAVREGTFRADLLYRLNVFPIDVPPLRERRSDIPLLVGLFVSTLARKLGKPLQGFSTRGMERLMAYGWPGNVRELQNVVERAAILAAGPVLEPERSFMTAAPPAHDGLAIVGAGDTLDNIQRAHIVAVLKTTGGVVEGAKGAATILGMHPNTLRSRMKKLGISSSA